MPFRIELVKESDLDEIARIDAVAMADNGPARALEKALPDGQTRSELFIMWMKKTFKQDKESALWKAVDDETGDIASMAKFTYSYEPRIQSTKEEEQGKDEGPNPYKRVTELTGLIWQNWDAFARENVEGQPHANLTVILTHPKYQRQGAGSLLLKEGLARADEAGLDTYCYASVQGRPLYERHGFEVVQVDSMDLSEYGVHHVEIRAVMRRPAQKSHK